MADDIIAHFDLGASEASKLPDFAEKNTTRLDEVYMQADTRHPRCWGIEARLYTWRHGYRIISSTGTTY
jgi:hypothetical protein